MNMMLGMILMMVLMMTMMKTISHLAILKLIAVILSLFYHGVIMGL